MARLSDDFETGAVPADAPRFCPNCGREDSGGKTSCPECGTSLIHQGYCAICEDTWPLPAGVPCPKHEVELEPGPPKPPPTLTDGEAPAWVTVGTYPDPIQAEAIRIRLEAEGIPTFLEGSRMGSRSMYQVATGGVKLQVPENLLADARVLLSQSWTPPTADDDLDDAWDELTPDPGSFRRSVMKTVILFLLLSPVLISLIGWCLALLG
jgi:hypothetical protein